jgi:peptidyl-prolyl cis-trans isomerase A (cyclophilin A)
LCGVTIALHKKKAKECGSFAFFLIMRASTSHERIFGFYMNRSLRFILSSLVLCTGAANSYAKPYVCFETNLANVSDICMEMLPESAPITVANFLKYVDDGDYTNSLVHRLVPGYVLQGGAYTVISETQAVSIPADPPIVNEYKLSNLRGTVAMARLEKVVNSATSSWFVNLVDNLALNELDEGFTVFARVVQGMDLIDQIATLPRYGGTGGLKEAPYVASPGTTSLTLLNFIRVVRAYRRETMLPYQCSATSPGDTLTEFCGSTVTFPVLVSGVLYEGTLQYIPGRAALEFSVDRSKLKVITDTGQQRATFANGVLTIPSVRNGAKAFDNVTLQMISSNPLEFRVTGYTAR